MQRRIPRGTDHAAAPGGHLDAARSFVRERREDLLLSLVVFVVIGAALVADVGGGRRPDAVAYLVAAGLAALMLVRRTLPVLALVATAVGIIAYYAAGYPSIGLAVPVAGALYSATEAGRLRLAVATGAGLLAVSTVFRLLEGEGLGFLLGYELASSAGLMAAAIALGDGVRSRRRWREEQRQRAAQEERDRHRELTRQRQQERLRIARDLHDSLAHATSVISLHAHVAEETLDSDPAAARTALANVRSAARLAIGELRGTVGMLRGDGDAPVSEGLDRIAGVVEATRASGLSVAVRTAGALGPLPEAVAEAAYRIVQESLTNVRRHADATSVEVVLDRSGDELRIRVTDDGRDRSPAVPGHGIRGMRERARLVAGSCEAGSLPAGGFQVEARLPVGEP